MDWNPIETAPKDGTEVLLFFPTFREGRRVRVGHYYYTETYEYGKLSRKNEGWFEGSMFGSIGDKPEPTLWAQIEEPND
jgi:hypothetical protein